MLLVPLAAAPAAAAPPPPIDLGRGVSLALVEIPAGTFTQGSAPGEPGHGPDEGRRDVRISRPFWIGRSPVTVGQFRRFTEESRYATEAEKGTSGGFGWDGSKLVQKKEFTWRSPGYTQSDDHPVVIVTYGDAQAFTAWLAQKSGLQVRLPTEAEWEMAARGGSAGPFFWGQSEALAEQRAWFAKNAGKGAMPVGSKPANEWGLQDAAGNVWQWCLDFHGPISGAAATDPFAASAVTWEHSDKPRRVLKGGSWLTNDRWKLRPAARNRATEGSRNADFGFRIVARAQGAPDPVGPVAPASPAGGPPPKSGSGCDALSPGAVGVGATVLGCGAFGCIGVLVLGAILLALRFLMKQSKGAAQARGGAAAPPRVEVRVVTDGFWLVVPSGGVGAEVSYMARTQSRTIPGQALVSSGPRGAFVYTGEPPIDVRITGVRAVAPARSGPAYHAGRSGHHYGHRVHHHDHDSGTWGATDNTSWPSAY
jgi:formylglycine-generating enzyme required for sulfatase activity